MPQESADWVRLGIYSPIVRGTEEPIQLDSSRIMAFLILVQQQVWTFANCPWMDSESFTKKVQVYANRITEY